MEPVHKETDAHPLTYRIRIVPTDGTLTRKKGLPDQRYPFHAIVERDGVVVGAEGACSEDDGDIEVAILYAVRQVRTRMKKGRK